MRHEKPNKNGKAKDAAETVIGVANKQYRIELDTSPMLQPYLVELERFIDGEFPFTTWNALYLNAGIMALCHLVRADEAAFNRCMATGFAMLCHANGAEKDAWKLGIAMVKQFGFLMPLDGTYRKAIAGHKKIPSMQERKVA